VRQLEQQVYGLVGSDLDALKQAFLRALSAVRPKRNRTPEDDGRSRKK
jgi:hypothetical protein